MKVIGAIPLTKENWYKGNKRLEKVSGTKKKQMEEHFATVLPIYKKTQHKIKKTFNISSSTVHNINKRF